MEIIFNQPWIIYIIVIIANAVSFKYRSKKFIAQNLELKEGYDNLFMGMLIYGNIPAFIILLGHLSGITENFHEYFSPKEMNPFVLTFHFSIIVLWVLGLRWIYFKDGAEFLETHPGLIQIHGFGTNEHPTATQIKIIFPFLLVCGIIGMVFSWA